jgi:hypothetical protein
MMSTWFWHKNRVWHLVSQSKITQIESNLQAVNNKPTMKSMLMSSHLLAVIKYIYLPPTYLHFIQNIEDMCLLLTSSTSFVDQPFQEHRMMEQHNMDQNPCISSLCPKQGIVTENMTRGNDVAQSTSSTRPRCGWPTTSPWSAAHVLAHF